MLGIKLLRIRHEFRLNNVLSIYKLLTLNHNKRKNIISILLQTRTIRLQNDMKYEEFPVTRWI